MASDIDLEGNVNLVVAPVHRDETIAYLYIKVLDHRQRLLELDSDEKILPKHHYLEHYPHLMRCVGPCVGLWAMRFEAKHSILKQVAQHTRQKYSDISPFHREKKCVEYLVVGARVQCCM